MNMIKNVLLTPLFWAVALLMVLFVVLGVRSVTAQPTAPQAPQAVPQIAVVTFTPIGGVPWVDSGIIVADHEYRDPNNIGGKEYTFRFVEFTDHVDEFHLDEGRVDIAYPPANGARGPGIGHDLPMIIGNDVPVTVR